MNKIAVIPIRSGSKRLPKKNYQSLIEYFSIESLVSLVSTSRLVGMVCPGLNSIYSSLDVTFNQDYSKKLISELQLICPINVGLLTNQKTLR